MPVLSTSELGAVGPEGDTKQTRQFPWEAGLISLNNMSENAKEMVEDVETRLERVDKK